MTDAAEAARLARYSDGSLQRALELADPELWSFRNTLLDAIAEPPLRSVALAQTVAAFVDGAGKEASARRGRLRQVVAFAVEFYRQLLQAQSASRSRLTKRCRRMSAGRSPRGWRIQNFPRLGSTAVSTPLPRSIATPTSRR